MFRVLLIISIIGTGIMITTQANSKGLYIEEDISNTMTGQRINAKFYAPGSIRHSKRRVFQRCFPGQNDLGFFVDFNFGCSF